MPPTEKTDELTAFQASLTALWEAREVARNIALAQGERLTESERAVLEAMADRSSIARARVAERAKTDAAWASRVIDRLIKRGFVERDLTDGERRNSPVRLTAAGRARLEAFRSYEAQLWKKAWRQLSPRLRTSLSEGVAALARDLSQPDAAKAGPLSLRERAGVRGERTARRAEKGR